LVGGAIIPYPELLEDEEIGLSKKASDVLTAEEAVMNKTITSGKTRAGAFVPLLEIGATVHRK
jgi:hypothetical protein